MNVNEIPWTQIGAFGSFAIVVLIIVLWFILKWRKGRNTSGTINKAKCINDPRFQAGLTDIAISKISMTEMKQDMKSLTEKTVEQTGILKGLFSETKKQTQVLEKVCNRMGSG